MNNMKTATDLYNYCHENNFGHGMTKGWGIKHFQLIVDAIKPDEEIKMAFIGLHNYISVTKHDSNFAYAVTNKRIIMAQKKLIGNVVQSVALDQVNDVTSSTGMLMTVITIDSIREQFNVAVDKISGQNITDKIHTLLFELKTQAASETRQTSIPSNITDELLKLKDLHDKGVLTDEEFASMKQRIIK